MRSAIRVLMLASAAFLAVSCASPWIKPGVAQVDGLALRTPVGWTAQSQGGRHLWTRDGVLLNALHIVVDLAPGQALFSNARSARDDGARFRAGMEAVELQELILEAMSAAGMRNVRALSTRPATIRGRAGFQSELQLDSTTGLHYRALLVAEGSGNSLTLLLFVAPAEFYFERDRAMVEGIFASIR